MITPHTNQDPRNKFWQPDTHSDRRSGLIARNQIKNAIRTYFEDEGFVEIDPPNIQKTPGNEIHLHGLKTVLEGSDGNNLDSYLRTSPEFACKKLLAAGERKVFCFAPSYRNREQGPLHHHEFTMLEWYRAGNNYRNVMADCEAILRCAHEITGIDSFQWRGKHCNPSKPLEKLTVSEAFDRYAKIPVSDFMNSGKTDRDAFAKLASSQGIPCAEDDTWSDIFSRVLTSRVEPNLGNQRPTILSQYPICEAAWAAPSATDPDYADRFELYCCGIELANGAQELTDPIEQHKRFCATMEARQRIYGEHYPIDEDLLSALSHMPPAAGVALGFDRLIMLATGAQRITDVMWAPLIVQD